MTHQNYVSALKHNCNVMNPEIALVASQVYTATCFKFRIKESNLIFGLMNPFHIRINESSEITTHFFKSSD